MLKIKNMGSSPIVISYADLRFRRDIGVGNVAAVKPEDFEEMSFDPGIQKMLKAGIIAVLAETEEEKELAASVVPEKLTIVDMAEARRIMETKDITAVSKIIAKAAPATKENLIAAAIEYNITDRPFESLFKKYCNIDIIDAIAMKRKMQD